MHILCQSLLRLRSRHSGLYWYESKRHSGVLCHCFGTSILLTKTTAVQNEVALRYYRVRGLYFLTVVFVTTVYIYYYHFAAEFRHSWFIPACDVNYQVYWVKCSTYCVRCTLKVQYSMCNVQCTAFYNVQFTVYTI